MLQCHAIQKLHRDKGMPVVFANFVDCADVGMIECRCGSGFPTKTIQSLRVFCNLVGQEFHCDKAAEVFVFSLIDNSHPATAEPLDNAVMRDGLPDHIRVNLRTGCGASQSWKKRGYVLSWRQIACRSLRGSDSYSGEWQNFARLLRSGEKPTCTLQRNRTGGKRRAQIRY